MRRIPIRIKLAAALAVPVIAMGLVTLIEVASVADDAREVRDQTNLATATIGPNGLITALQNERNWAAAQLVGVDQQLALDVAGYDETRAETDAALTEFQRELDSRGEAALAAYEPALNVLDGIHDLRTEIDAAAASATPSLANIGLTTAYFDRYTALIEPFFGGMSRISIAMDDPELRQGATLMEAVTRQLEIVPQLTNALVLPVSVPTAPGDRAGLNQSAEIAEVAELQDSFRRQAETLRTASGPFADIAAEWYPVDFTQTVDEQTDQAISAGTIDVGPFLASLDVPAGETLPYSGYRDAVGEALQDRADELNSAATTRQRTFALLMAVTFCAAVALTIVVSLSITRPLRSLTRQAKEMADRRLPDAVTEILETPLGDDVVVPTMTPVRVATRDEVADVAEALNTVQDSALDLAVEQAVLRRNIADSFVNLGRRNQNLLGRQLDFITELESNEADPDTLSSLFRLDHLATRMRRNAESLLVLAGIEPPRQWAAPVRVADVIRAALGEVEDYQRVTVRGLAPATVLGSVAADLAHLLAELVENALVFSPPDRFVEIRGVQRPGDGPDRPGGYSIAVVDGGLGMSAEDITSANRRLAGAESFTVAPSKYLGHYVAGNLAARHGIGVHLHSSPGSGVSATVELPPQLLTPDAGGQPGAQPAQQFRRPAAPLSPGGRPLAAGPPPAAPLPAPPAAVGPPAAVSRTQSGLARRTPRDGGAIPARADRTPAAPTDAQLASLARAAGWTGPQPGPTAPPGPTGPAWPPAGQGGLAGSGWPSAPPADHGAPPPLARRDRGAQMPNTAPVSLRRTSAPASPPVGPAPVAPPQPASSPPVQPPRAAAEVYGFLASFTAGVQRGLEASRGPDPHGGA